MLIRRCISCILTVLLLGVVCAVSPLPVAHAVGTIRIMSDGSVSPSDVPLMQNGDVYTFIGNITNSIIVERNNITINGGGFALVGEGMGMGLNLTSSSNVTIRRLRVIGFEKGIGLSQSSRNNISDNSIVSNSAGIFAAESVGNFFSNNQVTNNTNGIWLIGSPENNISGNYLAGNDEAMFLGDSVGNRLYENNIIQNEVGVQLNSSLNKYGNNTFYHNNFAENAFQVRLNSSSYVNSWDNGYPSGGNFWSDFNGTDLYRGEFQNVSGNDGLGDTPYAIDTNNLDRYPLIHPFGFAPCPDLNGDGEIDIKDLATAALSFGTYAGRPHWNFMADMNLDSEIDIRDLTIIAINFGKNCLVQILTVTVDRMDYAHLDTVQVTVTYRTRALQFHNIVLAATLQDNLGVPVTIQMQDIRLGSTVFGQFKTYVSTMALVIPNYAASGLATVRVEFLQKLGNGPFLALTPENTADINILAT